MRRDEKIKKWEISVEMRVDNGDMPEMALRRSEEITLDCTRFFTCLCYVCTFVE
jgi:hypothetical protein